LTTHKPSKRAQKTARARQVQELQIGGLSSAEIAEFLGISERTVWRDLKLVQLLNREEARSLDHEESLGERLAVLRSIRTRALQDYQTCPAHSTAKVGFLNTALKAEEKILQLQLKVGVIVMMPERLAVEDGLPFEDAEIRQDYLALLKKARAKGIKILGL
jgi:DNA-binding CsgD family transcriptional regulator